MYNEEFILKLYKIDGFNLSIQQRLVVSLYPTEIDSSSVSIQQKALHQTPVLAA